jgi:MFS family permease
MAETQSRVQAHYYGWRIAATLAITETISWGILYYAFSVFLTPMERELGWSRTELTAGFSLALLVTGAMAFPVGAWIDRHGARLLMTIGSIVGSVLVVAWSQVTNLTVFYLIWAGIGVCSAMVLYEPAFAVIAKWFHQKRTKALAIITFAAGLASTIFIPLSDALLASMGWRQAVFVLGVFLAATTIIPHALVIRRRPEDLGLVVDGGEVKARRKPLPQVSKSLADALHSRFFWLLIAAFSLAGIAASAIRVHFIPLLIGSGIDARMAALASGSIGIMQVAGRLVFAPLESRFSARVMVCAVFALQAVAFAILLTGVTTLAAAVFIVVFGTSIGAMTLARATVIGEVFGASHYGRISSVMAVFLTVSNTIAPVGAGLIFDSNGSYQPVIWGVVLLALIATCIMAIARPEREQTPASIASEP